MADAIKITKNRNVPMDKVRNIGIIAHIDGGKTTTTERILFYTGKIHKIGSVDEGTTTTDSMAQERERGITIQSACITTYWHDYRFNIIDTPGHVDFTAEVERSLRVLDGAIMIFDGNAGVQAQSETVWRQAEKYGVPRIAFVNKMDKVGASFQNTLKSIHDKLHAPIVPVVIPIGEEHAHVGVIDLINMKMVVYDKDPEGMEFSVTDITDEHKDIAMKYRAEMVEKIAGEDEDLMEKFLNDEEISVSELKTALRKATIARKLFPVYCGAAWRNKGIHPILDGIVDYLPSPQDLPPIEGFHPQTNEVVSRKPLDTEPLSSLLFKVQSDPHVGTLSYVRIYSGILKSGSEVYNTTKDTKERIGRLLLMHADKREGIEEGHAGEIVACIGLKESTTGDTLCDRDSVISLSPIQFSDPVISLSIEPESSDDQEKMGAALNRLSSEDPTFQVTYNHETGQTIIAGMGELYLEIIVDRLKREFGVNVKTGQPQVAYRETISVPADGEGKYIHQSGGHGQYGHCKIKVEPKNRGEGVEFINAVKGGAIPSNFIPAIEKGVRETLSKGIIAGYPSTDIAVTVYDGTYHEVDSSEMAFKLAGSYAIKDAFQKAKPLILEPIMKLEVASPSEFLGTVMGDLSSRRGQILGSTDSMGFTTIDCMIPLSEIRGYATVIRSLTQGRGSFYMEPSHYDPVPASIQIELTTKLTAGSKSA
ncbi:translation elongation factor G [Candidatus Shapirobacteria bacterium RIFOXYD1_FULL_38_32]|uniref:Elongation factor G n=3 Tax=Candidatus Shapironibacteriota TaxID=1752721 RepID=A0A0G0K3S5_9BACT|nr:MAG: Elongation factor G [Candidatus Shapirobacteria bacterium GW2011_GWE2_38_30]KKQ91397.1 MAG: Elongation factor G [Candidatus Shapirobacteria bacterium GW2011_GWE1_38_92]OGL57085.1 MAG: translation elongation factor G [Candidatus Shapirobacteria bacterium RIFOXYC1_FULL_38_24]OGL57440.1 MAG: translation elongation factor G [Candidatus Shapirobacteria bacterium RIFOXYB1_FULL_38_38]OGL58341.1 MAG: translation elongation factor G [Candidatus Shapirobacteria bacterium RIFOXYD1_FULL_38_32]HAP3